MQRTASGHDGIIVTGLGLLIKNYESGQNI